MSHHHEVEATLQSKQNSTASLQTKLTKKLLTPTSSHPNLRDLEVLTNKIHNAKLNSTNSNVHIYDNTYPGTQPQQQTFHWNNERDDLLSRNPHLMMIPNTIKENVQLPIDHNHHHRNEKDNISNFDYIEDALIPQRVGAVSAPPDLEVSSTKLLRHINSKTEISALLSDIRCDEHYESFYYNSQFKDKLPPPLNTVELLERKILMDQGKNQPDNLDPNDRIGHFPMPYDEKKNHSVPASSEADIPNRNDQAAYVNAPSISDGIDAKSVQVQHQEHIHSQQHPQQQHQYHHNQEKQQHQIKQASMNQNLPNKVPENINKNIAERFQQPPNQALLPPKGMRRIESDNSVDDLIFREVRKYRSRTRMNRDDSNASLSSLMRNQRGSNASLSGMIRNESELSISELIYRERIAMANEYYHHDPNTAGALQSTGLTPPDHSYMMGGPPTMQSAIGYGNTIRGKPNIDRLRTFGLSPLQNQYQWPKMEHLDLNATHNEANEYPKKQNRSNRTQFLSSDYNTPIGSVMNHLPSYLIPQEVQYNHGPPSSVPQDESNVYAYNYGMKNQGMLNFNRPQNWNNAPERYQDNQPNVGLNSNLFEIYNPGENQNNYLSSFGEDQVNQVFRENQYNSIPDYAAQTHQARQMKSSTRRGGFSNLGQQGGAIFRNNKHQDSSLFPDNDNISYLNNFQQKHMAFESSNVNFSSNGVLGSSRVRYSSKAFSMNSPGNLPFREEEFSQKNLSSEKSMSDQISLPPSKSPVPGRFASFNDVIGIIPALARDQNGCRYLQMKLEEGNPLHINAIYDECYACFIDLMVNPFGNYLCQKLFEHCFEHQQLAIVKRCSPALAVVSKDMHGTRAVQRIIECLSSAEQVQVICDALAPAAVELMKDINGNHVIQRCLHRLDPVNNQFIFDIVAENCFELATHRHGCCVIQRSMDYASAYQRNQVIKEITRHVLPLVQDPFGNYVVQYVLELSEPVYTLNIIRNLQGHLAKLSVQKFSSNAIEKCLQQAEPDVRNTLIEELISNPITVGHLLHDGYGNYVMQRLLMLAQGAQLDRVCAAIRPHLASLKSSPYGKRIQNKIVKLFPKGALRD